MQYSFNQIVYNADNSNHNVPADLTKDSVNGKLTEYTPLYQLGVRALPGTKFYLNGSPTPVIIGFNGVFEIDFTDKKGGFITSIQFDADSLKAIADNDSGYLVVDMMYLTKGEE